ncbi:uncharacterized protein LOC116200368 [Punica granatum]|uniref:Uncharacterized protein LOC116200368 n=1 Tax=Punica granatum TaxID=22663 RepID=A0A6P8D6W2_PUNGR|nr:uncharacterized protein LOC116200368 [Punica granatum]
MEAGLSSMSAIAPLVFDGENYHAWAVKMAAYMEGSDLWEAIEQNYEVTSLPDNPTMNQIRYHKERTTRKAKARLCLYVAISPIFTRIMRLVSAKEIWGFLKAEYEGDEKVRSMKVLNLMREFERQRMDESESVNEYYEKLINITNKIRILGSKMKDERLVHKILVSLLEKFEATIAYLENTKDLFDIKLAELLSALQAQEQRRNMRCKGTLEGVMQTRLKINAREKGKKWHNQKGNAEDSKAQVRERSCSGVDQKEKGKQYASYSPCQHCGKKGYPSFKCSRKPNVKCRSWGILRKFLEKVVRGKEEKLKWQSGG